jgi:predicted dehydrogenase
MKLASIGTSKIASMFLSAAKKAGGIEYTAAYSRKKETGERFAAENGAARVYTDLSAMAAAPEIDAVYIASPNRLHYEQSKLFLEHGKHVFCEKPMTTTKAEEEELYRIADGKGLVYAEAIMSIHTPAFRLLRETLPAIGKIRTVNLVFCQLSSRYPAYLAGELPNIFDPKLHAGCLMDIGVYNIYLAAALFGKPEKIVSDAVFLASGADACGSAQLRYPDLNVNLIYSKVGQNYAPSEIIGDKGTVSIQSVSQLTGIDLIVNGERRNLVEYEKTRDEVMGAEAAFFRDTVNKGGSPAYTFARETSLLVREITDEIRRQNAFPF